MGKYWNEEIECMAHEDMKKLQSERLVKQVKHVWDNVPYYKKLMEEKGVTPDDIHGIEDLHKLPFLSKADLREAYPYGLLAKPLSECVRIHSTSGTTGKRVVAFYTQHDIDLWENCCARAIVAAGGTKYHRCGHNQKPFSHSNSSFFAGVFCHRAKFYPICSLFFIRLI